MHHRGDPRKRPELPPQARRAGETRARALGRTGSRRGRRTGL